MLQATPPPILGVPHLTQMSTVVTVAASDAEDYSAAASVEGQFVWTCL